VLGGEPASDFLEHGVHGAVPADEGYFVCLEGGRKGGMEERKGKVSKVNKGQHIKT
jgi:hypothetical protein